MQVVFIEDNPEVRALIAEIVDFIKPNCAVNIVENFYRFSKLSINETRNLKIYINFDLNDGTKIKENIAYIKDKFPCGELNILTSYTKSYVRDKLESELMSQVNYMHKSMSVEEFKKVFEKEASNECTEKINLN